MNEKTLYWIWLTTLSGISKTDITALFEQFDDILQIYECKDFSEVIGIKPLVKARLKDKALKKANSIMEKINELGAAVLTFDSNDYPDSLRMIENPPYVLYVKGEILNWDRLLSIGIVGTRNSTDYGIAVTRKIAGELAACGVTIISGMARGIDTVAAKSALAAGNKTIAVFGCGLDIIYPPENAELMNEIINNGAVITEYPPGTEPKRINFPERNRIISGLSRGILVTEAPKKSGAIITANYAIEQGKDVFAVPGSIFKDSCQGTNELIGAYAKPVASAEDILCEYVYEVGKLTEKTPNKSRFTAKLRDDKPEKVNNEIKISLEDKKYQALGTEEKAVVELLLSGNMNIDDIKRESNIDIAKLTPILSMLEFGGYIKKLPGNNYKLNI